MMVSLTMGMMGWLSGSPEPAIPISSKKQLFLDDHLIASLQNVRREIHPAQKYAGNPVLVPTEPWEGSMAIVYGSVLRDGDRYRMWYLTQGGIGYAESADGIQWEKPRLGIVSLDGQDTNLVLQRDADPRPPAALPYFYEIFGVHRDDRDPDPSRRYKMGFLSIDRSYTGPREDPFHGGQRRGLGVAASPDGLHWRLLDNWATEAICDGDTHWMFDPARRKYVLYGRTKHIDPEVLQAWGDNEWVQRYHWGRSVARVESKDFLRWNITDPGSAPVVMSADAEDPPGTEIYSMYVFPYESVYIGLIQVFPNRPEACYLDIQLAVSHDSVHFTRVGDRRPFIPVGDIGTWDRFNNSLATSPPIVDGDQLRFYYGGRTYRHSPYSGEDKGFSGGRVGFATVLRDRFVSLGASFAGGQIVTKPVQIRGSQLHLNAQSDFGEIQVEVLSPEDQEAGEGRVLAVSQPVRQNGLDLPVEWEEGDIANLSGPVVLRLTLRNARLFALWAAER